MTEHFDAAYYEDLRGRVRGVLIATSEHFPSTEVGRLDGILDANEPGIVVEMLSQMLAEVGPSIDPDVVEQLERLARDMGLDPDVMERIRGLKSG